jgi:hypothetical protein
MSTLTISTSRWSPWLTVADRYQQLCIAKRGDKNRNGTLLKALKRAENDFETTFCFSRRSITAWALTISNPDTTVCLQAVDYFLWALQRLYETKVHQATGEITREPYLHILIIGRIFSSRSMRVRGLAQAAQFLMDSSTAALFDNSYNEKSKYHE